MRLGDKFCTAVVMLGILIQLPTTVWWWVLVGFVGGTALNVYQSKKS